MLTYRCVIEALNHFVQEAGDKQALQMCEKALASAPQSVSGRYARVVTLANIAQAQAKLGERTASIKECAKAVELLEKTDDDPTNAALRTRRAEAYMILGRAYAALAASEKIPISEANEHWRTAREKYQRSLDIYMDMRKHGIATGDDAGDQVTLEIAKCDAALQR